MGSSTFTKGQIGIEVTPGTAVAATRQLIGMLTFKDDRSRDTRADEQRGSFGGPNNVTDTAYLCKGKYVARATVEELVYLLALGMRGDLASTQPDAVGAPSVRDWVCTAPLSTIPDLKTASAYTGDNTQAQRALGMAVSKLRIKGGDDKPLRVEAELLGRRIQNAAFAAIVHPTTEDMKSLLTKWYIDGTGAGLGTTQVTGTFYEWEWAADFGISPDYTQDGSLDMGGFHRSTPKYSLSWTAKWNSAMVAEWANYDANTRRFIRLQNEGSTISGIYKKRLIIDGAYLLTEFEVLSGEKNGTNLVKVSAAGMEETTWGKLVEVALRNTLSAL